MGTTWGLPASDILSVLITPNKSPRKGHPSEPLFPRLKPFECMGATEGLVHSVSYFYPPKPFGSR